MFCLQPLYGNTCPRHLLQGDALQWDYTHLAMLHQALVLAITVESPRVAVARQIVLCVPFIFSFDQVQRSTDCPTGEDKKWMMN